MPSVKHITVSVRIVSGWSTVWNGGAQCCRVARVAVSRTQQVRTADWLNG